MKDVLKAGATFTKPFKATFPKGRSVVTDILKVFVSREPFELSALTQSEIRDVSGPGTKLNPITELLMDSTGMARGLDPGLSGPTDLSRWTVRQVTLQVKRAN
jgi:hypothetical protein